MIKKRRREGTPRAPEVLLASTLRSRRIEAMTTTYSIGTAGNPMTEEVSALCAESGAQLPFKCFMEDISSDYMRFLKFKATGCLNPLDYLGGYLLYKQNS
jgi:hypothetical protein